MLFANRIKNINFVGNIDNTDIQQKIMLFNKIIFGPVKSRRLGTSLGVNLLPDDSKLCNFNCIYCECGFNFTKPHSHLPKREEVKEALRAKLQEYADKNEHIDTITFAGNGEPTLHPQFAEIIDDVVELRNAICPATKISVLSNATFAHKPQVFAALHKVDNNILKLDSGIEETIKIINQPTGNFSLKDTVENLKKFRGNLVLQTLFFSGNYKGVTIDNTTDEEVSAWLKLVEEITPKSVMIYTLDRPTPAENLHKADPKRLAEIAAKVEALGIKTQING